MSLLAKMNTSAGYNVIYVHTMEIFPTQIRQFLCISLFVYSIEMKDLMCKRKSFARFIALGLYLYVAQKVDIF